MLYTYVEIKFYFSSFEYKKCILIKEKISNSHKNTRGWIYEKGNCMFALRTHGGKPYGM